MKFSSNLFKKDRDKRFSGEKGAMPPDWQHKKVDKNKLKEFDEKFAKDPTNVQPLYDKADYLSRHDKDKDAIKCYKQALEIEPKTASELCIIASNQSTKYYDPEALYFFEASLKIDPDNYNTLNLKSLFHAQREKYTDAIKCCEKMLEIKPFDGQLWETTGYWLVKRRKISQSIKCFEKMLEIKQHSATAICDKANNICYKPEANVELCNFWFGKAIILEPDNIEILKKHLKSLQHHNNFKEIIKFFDNQLKNNPREKFCWDEKINALLINDKHKELHKCGKQMLKAFPNDYDVLYKISQIFYDLKKYNDVLEPLSKVIHLRPGNRNPSYLKGKTLFWLKKNDDAMSIFHKLTKNDANDYDSWVYKGKIFRRSKNILRMRNKIDDMKKCYDYVLARDSENVEAIIAYGYHYYHDKKDDIEAYQHFTKAFKLDSDNSIDRFIKNIKDDWVNEIDKNIQKERVYRDSRTMFMYHELGIDIKKVEAAVQKVIHERMIRELEAATRAAERATREAQEERYRNRYYY